MLAHVIIMILYIRICCDQSLRVSFCIFLIQQPAPILYKAIHALWLYVLYCKSFSKNLIDIVHWMFLSHIGVDK